MISGPGLLDLGEMKGPYLLSPPRTRVFAACDCGTNMLALAHLLAGQIVQMKMEDFAFAQSVHGVIVITHCERPCRSCGVDIIGKGLDRTTAFGNTVVVGYGIDLMSVYATRSVLYEGEDRHAIQECNVDTDACIGHWAGIKSFACVHHP